MVEKYRESTFSFNLAWLEYEGKIMTKLWICFIKQILQTFCSIFSAKTIAMKIYFEIDAFDLLYSHLEAMKKFINRKEIIAYHKKNYLNTIKFTKKLLELPLSDRSVKKQLKNEIEATASIAEKNWLLQQLN